MNNYRKEFQNLEGVLLEQMRYSNFEPRYKEIKFHVVFKFKMYCKFTSKGEFVAVGHITDP